MADPIGAAKRRSVSKRRIGAGGICACGEDRPHALIPGTMPIVCLACKRVSEGRRLCDDHHVAGRANHDLTVPIPVNGHRAVLSEAQYEWPKTTLQNPHRSPLLAAAACIRGFIDTVRYLLEELLAWIPGYLEGLDALLVDRLGSRWWSDTELVERAKRDS